MQSSRRFLSQKWAIFVAIMGAILACFLVTTLTMSLYDKYERSSLPKSIRGTYSDDPLITMIELDDLVPLSERIANDIQESMNAQGTRNDKNKVKGVIIVL